MVNIRRMFLWVETLRILVGVYDNEEEYTAFNVTEVDFLIWRQKLCVVLKRSHTSAKLHAPQQKATKHFLVSVKH